MEIKLYFLVLTSGLVLKATDLKDSACPPRKFKCPSGKCVLKDFLCDGDSDCNHGWDERQCGPTCPRRTTKCFNGKVIDRRWLCDGDNDCEDHSDEILCSSICKFPSFRCANGNCIGKIFVCDGDNDCEDNSDELNCGTTCSKLEFQCRNGRKIWMAWVCDLDNDCRDNSDELNCDVNHLPNHNIYFHISTEIHNDIENIESSTITTINNINQSTLSTDELKSFNSTVPYNMTNCCENGGTCEIVDTSITCRCPVGYEGERCQVKKVENDKVKDKVRQTRYIIILISGMALAIAILSIVLRCFPKKMGKYVRAKTFSIVFHKSRITESTMKLHNEDNDDV